MLFDSADGGPPVTTTEQQQQHYEPETVELADASPEAMFDLFGRARPRRRPPGRAAHPRTGRRHAGPRRRRPRRGAVHPRAPRRDRHPTGGGRQRRHGRVPPRGLPRGAHRAAGPRPPRGQPAWRQRHHPPRGADDPGPRRDRREGRLQQRGRRLRAGQPGQRHRGPRRPTGPHERGRCHSGVRRCRHARSAGEVHVLRRREPGREPRGRATPAAAASTHRARSPSTAGRAPTTCTTPRRQATRRSSSTRSPRP